MSNTIQSAQQRSNSWRAWRVENCEVYNPKSVFNIYAPATAKDAAQLLQPLMVVFKQMNEASGELSFWRILGEQLKELAWSKERIKYAVNHMLRNHRYPTFMIADFLDIDKEFNVLSFTEAEMLPRDHPPLAKVRIDKKYCVVYKEDAEQQQLPHEEWMTTQEMKEKGLI